MTPRLVLAVDHETIVLNFLRAALTVGGDRVFAVCSTQDAWNTLELEIEERVDIFIADLVVFQPGMAKLIDHLRLQNPQLRILCISSFGEWEVENSRHAWQDVPVLYKPFTARALWHALRFDIAA